jgi:[ribosomal protein S5]-alanine N-acetyltransferase
MLETQRLFLREMSLDNLDFVAAMLAHPEVMRYWPKCYNREEAADWIKRQQQRYAKHGVGYWLALDKSSSEPVGQAGLLVQQVDGVEEIGLGYIIHRPFWRMGFATEAAAASMDYAFNKLGRNRVIALVRPENIPSQEVALNLGMKIEKSTHFADYQHLVFAALHDSPRTTTGAHNNCETRMSIGLPTNS